MLTTLLHLGGAGGLSGDDDDGGGGGLPPAADGLAIAVFTALSAVVVLWCVVVVEGVVCRS
jgi:hypothetical protein